MGAVHAHQYYKSGTLRSANIPACLQKHEGQSMSLVLHKQDFALRLTVTSVA
jgi:hypothetical protein